MMLIFSIFDSKSMLFSRPIATTNEATAKRLCAASLADPQSDYHRNPEDFSLFVLGTFDDTSGKLVMEDSPRCIAPFVTLLKQPA